VPMEYGLDVLRYTLQPLATILTSADLVEIWT
jgi:hypothetical protein